MARPPPPPVPSRRPLVAAAAARWGGLSRNVRGAAMVMLGAFLLIVMATLVKHLGRTMPVFEIIFVRFLVGLLVLVPLFARIGFRVLRTRRPGLHFLRGLVGTAGNLSFFLALTHMAMADAVTIQFSRPLFLIVIAALFLGERPGLRRAAATAVGFSGILIITRPFAGGFEPWALVAAAGALNGSLVVLAVKLLSRTEQTMVIMFYFALWTTALSFLPALAVWQTPSWGDLALLVLIGVIGIVGQSCFTHGIGLGETTFVMPFDYFRIVFSAIFGVVLFAEVPDAWSLAGAAVIIASSLYLLRAETQARAAARARQPPTDQGRVHR